MMNGDKLICALLSELTHVTSNEECAAYDVTWLRGYVSGISNAASIIIELEQESDASKGDS